MDIDHLGEAVIEQLVDLGKAKRISDLYTLGKEDFLALDGFAEKSAENLFNSIAEQGQGPGQASLRLGYQARRFIGAKELARNYESLKEFAEATTEDLVEIDGIGSIMAESVVEFFASHENRLIIEGLSSAGVETSREPTEPGSSPCRQSFRPYWHA